jgi:hypothetical protein
MSIIHSFGKRSGMGAVRSKFDALDYFHQSVLSSLERSIKDKKSFPTAKLKKILNDLKETRKKFGGKNSTKMEDLYNEAQVYYIQKELKSRK